MSVAASYSASFTPITRPVAGFEQVKSNLGTNTLGRIAFDNFAMRSGLANAAITAKAETSRLKESLAAQLKNQDNALRQQRVNGLRMAGSSLANLFGGGGAASAPVAQIDPFTALSQVQGYLDNEKVRRDRDSVRVRQSALDAVGALAG